MWNGKTNWSMSKVYRVCMEFKILRCIEFLLKMNFKWLLAYKTLINNRFDKICDMHTIDWFNQDLAILQKERTFRNAWASYVWDMQMLTLMVFLWTCLAFDGMSSRYYSWESADRTMRQECITDASFSR